MALSNWSRWALTFAGAAAGALAVGWLFKKPADLARARTPVIGALPNPPQTVSDMELFAAALLEWPAPPSVVMEPSPASEQLSARPRDADDYRAMADDYDSMDPEDLGAAFLAGATDTPLEPPPGSTADLSGFQIFEPSDIEPS